MPLLVTVAGLAPGAPLAAAGALADALDARRVPLTWLVGPRPHPEVADWVDARRRVGDAVLLHGTAPAPAPAAVGRARPYRRLPAHEAGLRVAGALRAAEACGLGAVGAGLDGFAAPGWAVSAGTRAALAAAGLDLLAGADGLTRLGPDGAVRAALLAPAVAHVRAVAAGPVPRGHTGARDAGAAVDRALAAGAVPAAAPALLPAPAPALLPTPTAARRPRPAGTDPERWSITA